MFMAPSVIPPVQTFYVHTIRSLSNFHYDFYFHDSCIFFLCMDGIQICTPVSNSATQPTRSSCKLSFGVLFGFSTFLHHTSPCGTRIVNDELNWWWSDIFLLQRFFSVFQSSCKTTSTPYIWRCNYGCNCQRHQVVGS